MEMLDYLHARGVTYAVFSEGPYDESAAFREFMGYSSPWYSAKDYQQSRFLKRLLFDPDTS